MLPDLMVGATLGADGRVTESGWSNSKVFRYYLENHFLKFVFSHTENTVIVRWT